jgi:hypothetical protein
MNKLGLLALADHMEALDPERYDQDIWFTGDLDENNAVLGEEFADGIDWHARRRVTIKEGACNTVACVLGNATSVPGLGLFLGVPSKYLDVGGAGEFLINDVNVCFVKDGELHMNGHAGVLAFDIPTEHADVLFGTTDESETLEFYGAIDTKSVAAKLREYVETDGANMEALLARFEQ